MVLRLHPSASRLHDISPSVEAVLFLWLHFKILISNFQSTFTGVEVDAGSASAGSDVLVCNAQCAPP